jgi:hypothetical protein
MKSVSLCDAVARCAALTWHTDVVLVVDFDTVIALSFLCFASVIDSI